MYNSCRVTVPGTFLWKKRTKTALLSGSIARPQGPCSQQPRKPLSARWILKDKYNSYQIPKGPNNAREPTFMSRSSACLQSIPHHMTQMQFSLNIRSPKCSTFLIFDLYFHFCPISPHQYFFPFQLGLFFEFSYISTFPYTPCITQLSSTRLKASAYLFFAHAKQLEGPGAKGEFSTVSKASI